MIKSKNGKGTMKGDVPAILSDYSSITKALVDALVKADIPKEEAVEMVKKAHRLGLMTKEELEKEVMEKISRILSGIANEIQNEYEKEETNE